MNAETIYKDLLQMLFNSANPGKLQVENLKGSREDWEAKNILFQVEDKERYVGKVFEKVLAGI